MADLTPTKQEHLFKILVIGDLGVGKTSLIKRFVHDFFSTNYKATIGVDFALKVLKRPDRTVRLQLWDIGGQEKFSQMTSAYFKNAIGAFIVFDVTRPQTFDAVSKWKYDLDSKVYLPDNSSIPAVLLANKCDQTKEGLVNNRHKMDEYCNEHKYIKWFETSAKEGYGIDEAAECLVSKILEIENANNRDKESPLNDSPLNLKLTNSGQEKKKKRCCGSSK
ncbi:ras-related protein Rab-38-like [Convolutriloba macropyga]|uniref:ras-related protein Rab-38-like n=1 Tax=Convolutriloba macropyga TaxID=536237 RepID=UPI003F524D1F